MDQNELLGRSLQAWGWVATEDLASAFEAASRRPGVDICDVLLGAGRLNADQARRARVAVAGPSHEASSRAARGPLDTRIEAVGPAPLSASHEGPAVGKPFLGYVLEGEINRGAMGVIFRARRLDDGRVVALKFMLDSGRDENELARFGLEIATLVSLKHPNIIEIVDGGQWEGHPYFAMELIEGRDLRAEVTEALRLEGHALAWRDAVALMSPIADALAYCHEREVLHRDVKPQNVLIQQGERRPVLADFGLIKREGGGSDSSAATGGLTRAGEIVGTPAFMSPEQFAPNGSFGKVGPASDVWGFGATLYFCLTGQPPFDKQNMVEIFQAIVSDQVPNLAQRDPTIPRWLAELILDCLSKQCADRPAMRAVADRLASGLLAARPRSARRFIMGLVGGVALAAIALLAALRLTAPPRLVELGWTPKDLTREDRIRINGRLDRGAVTVHCRSASAVSDGDGRFELRAILEEGQNILLVAIDESSEEPREIRVQRDSQPPRITIEPNHDLTGVILLGPDLTLRGQLIDPNGPELSCDGVPCALDPDGRFQIVAPASAQPIEVRLQVQDRVGNKAVVALRLLSPEAIDQQARGIEEGDFASAKIVAAFEAASAGKEMAPADRCAALLLWNHEKWARAEVVLQDRAIALVAARLGPAFQPGKVQVFECGGRAYRIAGFRHEKTGLDLSLIPGGLVTMSWRSDEGQRELIDGLRVLERVRYDLDVLQAALGEGAFAEARQSLARALKVTLPERRERRERGAGDREAEAIIAQLRGSAQSREALPGLITQLIAYYEKETPARPGEHVVAPFLMARVEASAGLWRQHGGAAFQARLEERRRSRRDGSRHDHGDEAIEAPSAAESAPLPITNIEARSAEAWLAQLGDGLRLPDLLEWIHACGAGATTDFFWGDDAERSRDYCWSTANTKALRPVHEHDEHPNAFGLSDMLGNAAEYCAHRAPAWLDVWDPVGSREGAARAAKEFFEDQRPVMGGHFLRHPQRCRTRLFRYEDIEDAEDRYGFRCAVAIPWGP